MPITHYTWPVTARGAGGGGQGWVTTRATAVFFSFPAKTTHTLTQSETYDWKHSCLKQADFVISGINHIISLLLLPDCACMCATCAHEVSQLYIILGLIVVKLFN